MLKPEHSFAPEPETLSMPSLVKRRALLKALVGAGGVAATGALAGCGIFGGDEAEKPGGAEAPDARPEFDTQEHNLLAEGEWELMPGSETDGKGGLNITHTGLAIRKKQDQWWHEGVPEYFPNPPVNAWTHVEMSQADGDIGLTARLTDIEGSATLLFQGDPTFRYDERIYQHAGMGVEVEGNTATVKVWFGTGEEPDITESIDLGSLVSEADISLTQADNSLTVSVNGEEIAIPDAKVFESGQVWFGTDASQSWRLSELEARPLGDNQIRVIDSTNIIFGELNPEGLQAVVAQKRPDIVVGSAIDLIPLTHDEAHARLVVENCDGLATEVLAKPQNLQPKRGKFVWDDLDAFVALADTHEKKKHLHTLVFGEAIPEWMETALAGASKDEALTIMRDHIKPVMSRHKFDTVDVINEPFSAENWADLRRHTWYEAIGETYIEEAFRAAHEADPDALLGLNEWALEHDPDRWEALIDMLKGLQAKDVPIHFIGFQMHLDPDAINEILGSDELTRRFEQLEDMGLKVRVSEFSAEGVDPQRQAEAMGKVMRVCMQAKNCIGVNFWGMASNETQFNTYPDENYNITPEQYGNDAPWQKEEDGSYSRKPAADALFDAAETA